MWVVTTAGVMVNIATAKTLEVREPYPDATTTEDGSVAVFAMFSDGPLDLAIMSQDGDAYVQAAACIERIKQAIAKSEPLIDLSQPEWHPSASPTIVGAKVPLRPL